MANTLIIVGGQFGDEGKGKIVDFLAEKADMIVRYSGGNNAGHTVVSGGETFKLHIIPSGIIRKNKVNIIGNGTVVNPDVLVDEMENLEKMGLTVNEKNLILSSAAHVISERHIMDDSSSASSKMIGTTGRGIGPCYCDKVARTGTRIGDFVKGKSGTAVSLRPFVKDTYSIINDAIDAGKHVLFEGAQGTLLDVDHGTYPFVTSSNSIAGGALIGSGVGPTKIREVCGVFKAYSTRVGGGPFPTELGNESMTKEEDSVDMLRKELSAEGFERLLRKTVIKANEGDAYTQGRLLRMQGYEYGTTTSRPRRTGWFDGVAARYAARVNGMTCAAITKLDVLRNLDKIKICVAYLINGKQTGNFLLGAEELSKAVPVYEEMSGWKEDISKARKADDLPAAAKNYLGRLQQVIGVPIGIISVGAGREETIPLGNMLW